MKLIKIFTALVFILCLSVSSKTYADPDLQNILSSAYNTLPATIQYKMRTDNNLYATTTPCGIQLTLSSATNSSMPIYVYRDTSPTFANAVLTPVTTSYATYQTPWNSNPGGSVYLHLYTDFDVNPNTTYYYKIRYGSYVWTSVVSAKSNTPNSLTVDWVSLVYPYYFYSLMIDSPGGAYYNNACPYLEPRSVSPYNISQRLGWDSLSNWSSNSNSDFSCSGSVKITWPASSNDGYYWDNVYNTLYRIWKQYGYWRIYAPNIWSDSSLVYKNGDNVTYNVYEQYRPIYTVPYSVPGIPQYSNLRPILSLIGQNISTLNSEGRVTYTAAHKPVAPANYEFDGYAVTAVKNSSQSQPIYIQYWEPAACSSACVSPSTFDQTKGYIFTDIENFDAGNKNVVVLSTSTNQLEVKDGNSTDATQQWYIKPSGDSNFAQIVSKSSGKALSVNGSIIWGAYDDSMGTSYTRSSSYVLSGITNTFNAPILAIASNTSDDSQKWCIRKNDPVNTGGSTSYSLINKKTQSVFAADSYGGPTSVGAKITAMSYDYVLPWYRIEDELDAANYLNYDGTVAAYVPQYQENAPSLWAISTTSPPRSCTVGTTTIADAVSQTFYNSVSSPTCSSLSRTCTDGTMSGDSQYTYPSCALSCTKPDGTILQSGNTSDYWIKDQSTDCDAEKRTLSCNSGTLTGTSATYYTSCTPLAAGIPPTTINSFLVKPALVSKGQKCSLFWNISTSTTCTITGSNSYSVTLQSTAGDNSITPNSVSNRTKYTLTCGGNSAVKNAVCSVVPGYKEF